MLNPLNTLVEINRKKKKKEWNEFGTRVDYKNLIYLNKGEEIK